MVDLSEYKALSGTLPDNTTATHTKKTTSSQLQHNYTLIARQMDLSKSLHTVVARACKLVIFYMHALRDMKDFCYTGAQ